MGASRVLILMQDLNGLNEIRLVSPGEVVEVVELEGR
jgi:hypothetical protein